MSNRKDGIHGCVICGSPHLSRQGACRACATMVEKMMRRGLSPGAIGGKVEVIVKACEELRERMK